MNKEMKKDSDMGVGRYQQLASFAGRDWQLEIVFGGFGGGEKEGEEV